MIIVVSCEIILRVDGQTSGGASCEELHVYDSNTCNDWCGGGAALMPTSIFFNGNTCTCQNCPLRSKGQECPKDGQTTCFNPPGTPDGPPAPPSPVLPWLAGSVSPNGARGMHAATFFGAALMVACFAGLVVLANVARKKRLAEARHGEDIPLLTSNSFPETGTFDGVQAADKAESAL